MNKKIITLPRNIIFALDERWRWKNNVMSSFRVGRKTKQTQNYFQVVFGFNLFSFSNI